VSTNRLRPGLVRTPRGRQSVGREVAADWGSATVWVMVACLVTWSAVTLAASIGGVVVARHRAGSAADLAALAGAHALINGVGDPCAEAERVAAATRVRLVACERMADGSLQVVVEAPLPRLLASWTDLPPARARARAGQAAGVSSRISRFGRDR
jgi:secretion/DNA translocation related TadE-like protein